MKQLSDLLDAATASAPPARYDVEDAVAAGRRLQRRRNTGWAIAAVTAVAVAIGVPQIVTRRSAPPVQPVVTTTTAPPAVKLRSFVYPFAAYTAGHYRVQNPALVTLGSAQAVFGATGHAGSINGTLTVFRPGVDASFYWSAAELTDSPPINGGRAFFLDWPKVGQRPATSGLAWQYAEGAWAIVSSRLGPMKRASLTEIAQRFPAGQARPARLGFRATYVPPGYRLVQVDLPNSTAAVSGALFGLASSAAKQMSEKGMTATYEDTVGIQLTRLETSERAEWPSATAVCPKTEQYCYRSLDSGRYLLQVRSARVTRAEMLKMLKAVTLADPANQGTWTDVNSAAPASAQLPAE